MLGGVDETLRGLSTFPSHQYLPDRIRDQERQVLRWANAFLDGQHLRQLSPWSLCIYSYDLLD